MASAQATKLKSFRGNMVMAKMREPEATREGASRGYRGRDGEKSETRDDMAGSEL